MVQTCIWFKEEPSQFSMGQTAQGLTCSIMEKPLTWLEESLRILLSCFRARNSASKSGPCDEECPFRAPEKRASGREPVSSPPSSILSVVVFTELPAADATRRQGRRQVACAAGRPSRQAGSQLLLLWVAVLARNFQTMDGSVEEREGRKGGRG